MKKGEKKKLKLELYTDEQAKTIEKFIEDHFGRTDRFLEENEPHGIKIKFCIIPPNRKNHCFTIVTTGMGAHVMRAEGRSGEVYEGRAELVISLPPDWNTESFENEDFWPFILLEVLAKMPVKDGAWLSWGRTVEFDQSFASNTGFKGAMLICSAYGEESWNCKLNENEEVSFYQVIPLYSREIEYKTRRNASALLDCFENFSHIVDIERPCVVPDDYENIIDTVEHHSSKIIDKELDIPEINGANHIAAYLRWAIDRSMINDELDEFFAEEIAAIKSGDLDVRKFLIDSLGGELSMELFTEEGQRFSAAYYNFYPDDGEPFYPNDVDNMALDYYGEEKYNCDEFKDEAYLFVPFDERYYAAMCRYIDKNYRRFKAAEE